MTAHHCQQPLIAGRGGSMLDITRERAFGRAYQILLDGTPVARWSAHMWKSGGHIELAGETLELRSTSWGRTFEMLAGKEVRATAHRRGRKWLVTGDEGEYVLARPSAIRGRRELLLGDRSLGEFRRSRFGNGLTADISHVSPSLQVFVSLVVLTLWRRQDAATVAAASSG